MGDFLGLFTKSPLRVPPIPWVLHRPSYLHDQIQGASDPNIALTKPDNHTFGTFVDLSHEGHLYIALCNSVAALINADAIDPQLGCFRGVSKRTKRRLTVRSDQKAVTIAPNLAARHLGVPATVSMGCISLSGCEEASPSIRERGIISIPLWVVV